MKKIMTLLIVCVLMGLKACVDNNGNYDYLSQDLVTIAYDNTGTGANITCVEGTELVIEPIITWKNPSDSVYFEYTWIADNDTISHEKVLRYTFPEIRDYYLLFYATDTRTGISYTEEKGMAYIVTVTTRYKTGLMVLYKDASGNSELGFIKVPDGGLAPSETYPWWDEKGLYARFHSGEPMGSEPIRLIQHFSSNTTADDQILVIQRGGQGPLELDGGSLKKVILTSQEFLNEEVPVPFEPVDVCYDQNINVLLNSDGKLYTRMITNPGYFQTNAYTNVPMNIDVDNGVSGGTIGMFVQPALSSLTSTMLAYDKTPEHKRMVLVSMLGNNRAGMAIVSCDAGWPTENYVPLDDLGNYDLVFASAYNDGMMTSMMDANFHFVLRGPDGKYYLQGCYMPYGSIGNLQVNSDQLLREIPMGDAISNQTKFLDIRDGNYLFFTGGTDNRTVYCYHVNTNETTVFFQSDEPISALCVNEMWDFQMSFSIIYTALAVGTTGGKVHFVDASRESIRTNGNPMVYKTFEGFGEIVDITYKYTSAMTQFN